MNSCSMLSPSQCHSEIPCLQQRGPANSRQVRHLRRKPPTRSLNEIAYVMAQLAESRSRAQCVTRPREMGLPGMLLKPFKEAPEKRPDGSRLDVSSPDKRIMSQVGQVGWERSMYCCHVLHFNLTLSEYACLYDWCASCSRSALVSWTN
jgi:hypothetical protein